MSAETTGQPAVTPLAQSIVTGAAGGAGRSGGGGVAATHRGVRSADGQFTALILGFFGAAWFGWAHAGSPALWSVPLSVASVASLAVAALGAVRMWPVRRDLSARDHGVSRRYGIVVGISYALILIGNVVINKTGHPGYIAPWVAFGIGAHFWALLPVLKDRILIPLGAVVVAFAGLAVVLPAYTELEPSAIAGVGAGASLLVVSIIELSRRKPAASAALVARHG